VVVGPGDSIYTIAEQHGVAVEALVAANDLSRPYSLYIDQRLRLPPPGAYTVRKGDTLYSIARRHSVDLASLALMNELAAPYTLHPGQVVYLPTLAVAGGAPRRAEAARRWSASYERPAVRGPAPLFDWPLRGRVISGYGPQGGSRNDGLNIAAVEGEPVRAAADGEVVYAAPFKGYGQFMLIRHSGGWVSVYGHNRRLLAAQGDAVKKGQAIAEAGSTGAVDTPQLHFELRVAGQPIDPVTRLPAM
ncbi:MAG: M23 family metallopeptidase, partial [Caulobacterales bacterium]|nr:M23 family metallopeptidase [Caulobacterales bacterium]